MTGCMAINNLKLFAPIYIHKEIFGNCVLVITIIFCHDNNVAERERHRIFGDHKCTGILKYVGKMCNYIEFMEYM